MPCPEESGWRAEATGWPAKLGQLAAVAERGRGLFLIVDQGRKRARTRSAGSYTRVRTGRSRTGTGTLTIPKSRDWAPNAESRPPKGTGSLVDLTVSPEGESGRDH